MCRRADAVILLMASHFSSLQELFVDPVIAADGFTYERSAIEDWLTRKKTSPMTNVPLEHERLIPNLSVSRALKAFFWEYSEWPCI